ncbi:MAG TPA: hypothetical protein VI168_03160 [Croceibacterium sp.]
MRLFRILFAIDVLVLLMLAYLFVDWLREPRLAGDRFGIWVLILGVPMLVLGGSWALNANGKTTVAKVLLGVLAAPFVAVPLRVGLSELLKPPPCKSIIWDGDSNACADPAWG